MFDLRYHVASLAAVFLALIIGILVGVGISSGTGGVTNSERNFLHAQNADLQRRVDAEKARVDQLTQEQKSAQAFVRDTYPGLMGQRLAGRRVAIVFVGSTDNRVRSLIEQALQDAGANAPVRVDAIKVPLDVPAIERAIPRRTVFVPYRGNKNLDALGHRLAQEFVTGGRQPLWGALTSLLVEERSGSDRAPVDGVVVVRSAPPQQLGTARFLAGFYSGLQDGALPAVGVETTGAGVSAVPPFSRAGVSTVDDLDAPAGRLALAVLLAGGASGDYGVKAGAKNGLLPPVTPVVLAPPGG